VPAISSQTGHCTHVSVAEEYRWNRWQDPRVFRADSSGAWDAAIFMIFATTASAAPGQPHPVAEVDLRDFAQKSPRARGASRWGPLDRGTIAADDQPATSKYAAISNSAPGGATLLCGGSTACAAEPLAGQFVTRRLGDVDTGCASRRRRSSSVLLIVRERGRAIAMSNDIPTAFQLRVTENLGARQGAPHRGGMCSSTADVRDLRQPFGGTRPAARAARAH